MGSFLCGMILSPNKWCEQPWGRYLSHSYNPPIRPPPLPPKSRACSAGRLPQCLRPIGDNVRYQPDPSAKAIDCSLLMLICVIVILRPCRKKIDSV